LGVAKDGGVDVFICQRWNHATPALRWHVKDEHVRYGHVKDAAQDEAEDVTQDLAEDALGAAEDGSSSVSGGKIIIILVVCP